MTDQTPRPPSRFDKFVDILRARLGTILLALALSAAAATYFEATPTVPRTGKLLILVVLVFAPVGWMTGKYISSLLWEPAYQYLIDLDARDDTAGLYRLPAENFRDLEVTSGQLDQTAPNLYFGRNLDLEEQTVEGTWRGTLTDRELLTAIEKIDECRTTLEDDAKKGFALETRMWSIVRSAVQDATISVVRTFETSTLPDNGDSINEQIDQVLDQYDLDRGLEDIDSLEEDVTNTRDNHDNDDKPDDYDQPESSNPENGERNDQIA